jgi:hypothetical protein
MLNLVGRYQYLSETQNFIDDSRDLHIIAIDEEENSVFLDTDSSPSWIKIAKRVSQDCVELENKILLDSNTMKYKVLDN